ncbi:HPr kinase/phosphorylase [Kumtagia ephedrae]|uniref:Serine kinase n=1 Tax=Kumtagia ephedrae TaxID=2116701 RepID=A0A2P7S6E2_9HYPH|nr:serine kinase [Mesorhizobium ephedrae]PSJ58043.1 serine kinase [Mesorhizobium ephedrae]
MAKAEPGYPPNLHATGIVVGDRGILIRGESGSGKTTLALAVIAAARAAGRFATLVADDQLLLARRNGRLVCTAPAAIAGLVEVRGSTPQPIGHEAAAVVDLLIRLVDGPAAPRYREEESEEIGGCRIPVLTLERRNAAGAFAAIAARLSLPPFG